MLPIGHQPFVLNTDAEAFVTAKEGNLYISAQNTELEAILDGLGSVEWQPVGAVIVHTQKNDDPKLLLIQKRKNPEEAYGFGGEKFQTNPNLTRVEDFLQNALRAHRMNGQKIDGLNILGFFFLPVDRPEGRFFLIHVLFRTPDKQLLPFPEHKVKDARWATQEECKSMEILPNVMPVWAAVDQALQELPKE